MSDAVLDMPTTTTLWPFISAKLYVLAQSFAIVLVLSLTF